MQSSVPVALPAPITAAPPIGKPLPAPTDFTDQLMTLLAAIAPAGATSVASTGPMAGPQSSSTKSEADGSHATDTSLPLPPSAVPTTVASARDQASALTTLMAEVAEPRTAPMPADQAEAAPAPLPPPAIDAPGPELPKTWSAPDATTGRSRAASTVRRNTETAAPASAGGAEVVQPALPLPVVIPATEPPPPPPAALAPTDAAAQQTSPAGALPVSNAPEKPPALPTDAPQPTALIDAETMHQQPAADSDVKPAPVTAPAASIAPVPSLPATPSVQTPTSPTATTGTPHPSPVAQITPALVSMSHTPDGAQRLTMKLEPPELGQVHIQIDRPTDDAPARVAITVERPETLQLLLHDQPQLQRALDQAGVPAEGRSVTFHVVTPEPAARTETAMAPTPTGSSAAMGGDFSHSASRQGGRPMQPETGTSGATDDNEDLGAITVTPTRWLRAGLDITA